MISRYIQCFGTVGGTATFANPVSSGYTDTVAGNVCPLTIIVWVPPPYTDIATGVQVYINKTMTLKLLGQSYIKDSTGKIFNISTTGVVGAPVLTPGGEEVIC